NCRALTDEIKTTLQDVKEELEAPVALETALLAIQEEQSPLTCWQFEELITEFLDGFIPASLYHKFEAHTASCHSCSTLVTGVVFAVAAFDYIHIEEEFAVSNQLNDRLLAIMPKKLGAWRKRWTAKVTNVAAALIPRHTQSRRWNFATASGLLFAT